MSIVVDPLQHLGIAYQGWLMGLRGKLSGLLFEPIETERLRWSQFKRCRWFYLSPCIPTEVGEPWKEQSAG
jgi:hypothetical protein